jgi:hypothetical protein
MHIEGASHAAEGADGVDLSIGQILIPHHSLKKGSCRTDIHTGTAKLTSCVDQGPIQDRAHHSPGASIDERDGRGSSNLLTDSHAPAAEDAQVVISIEERICLPDIQMAVERRIAYFIYIQGFHHVLKLAASIVGTENTACHFPHFADGGLVFIAVFLFSAYKAGIGMLRKDKPQHLLPPPAKTCCIGLDFHSFFHIGSARRGESSPSLDFNDTQPAPGKGS